MKTIKKGFARVAQSDEAHDIFMYGVIGWDFNVRSFLAEIENIPQSVKELNFYIHSPGGLVFDGYAILTNLRKINNRYHTRGYIDGIAASMASAIAVEMNELVASPTSKMIIHDPMANLDIYGGYNRTRIRELIEDLENIEEGLEGDADLLASVYAKKTGLDLGKVKELWLDDGKDHELTPQQMIDFGLANSINEKDFELPEQIEEEDEEDWLSSTIFGMRAACTNGNNPGLYRGNYDKILKKFAFDKNPDEISSTDGFENNKNNLQSKPMKFAQIAQRLGLDTAVDENTILSRIDTIQTDLTKSKAEEERLTDLVDEYKKNQKEKEGVISSLKENLRKSKTGTVVDEVISEAEKDVKGRVVNVKIREKLSSLAIDYLEAEENENEAKQENIKEHMSLLAKNNLVPIGENPDLKDEKGTSARKVSDKTAVSEDRVEEARKRGQKKLEQQKKTWNVKS